MINSSSPQTSSMLSCSKLLHYKCFFLFFFYFSFLLAQQLLKDMTSKHTIYKEAYTRLLPRTERQNKLISIGNYLMKVLIKIKNGYFPRITQRLTESCCQVVVLTLGNVWRMFKKAFGHVSPDFNGFLTTQSLILVVLMASSSWAICVLILHHTRITFS